MAGGRPAKPISIVKGHRTMAEINIRQKEEAAMATGILMQEWPETKSNKIAHKEFLKITAALNAIEKNDVLLETVMNNYCLLVGECDELRTLKDATGDIKTMMEIDRALMQKRKMLLDIAKENLMTAQSALRAIPKKPEPKKASPMADFLARQKGG